MKRNRTRSSLCAVKLVLAAVALTAASAGGCVDEGGFDLSGGSGGAGGGGTGSGAGATTGQGAGSTGAGAGSTGAGGEGGAPLQEATFELSFDDAAPSMELRDDREITVYIAPNGYEGPVDLTFDGLPPDVTGQLADTTVTLDGAATKSTKLSFTTLSSTVTGAFEVSVSGSVVTGTKTSTATLTVIPTITIYIPQGLNGMQGSSGSPNTAAFGDFPTILAALPNMSAQNPITVNFFNGDSVPHRIHAGNPDQGFPHGDVDIPPGQMDPTIREVNTPGTYTYYPHDIDNTILGRIRIE